MFEVFDVLHNQNHPQHENLLVDLKNISQFELEKYIEKNNIDHLLSNRENKEIETRAYFHVENISRIIFETRISKLLDYDNPEPNVFENISDLNIDKNSLVFMRDFDLTFFSLCKNNLVYSLTPTTIASNSSYWIYQALLELTFKYKINFKIRLDPYIELPREDYNPMMYKMYVHGKPLNWKRLLTLRFDEFGQWMTEKDYHDHQFTDYCWSPKKDGTIHFTCEEIPKGNLNRIKSSRYFHAIFRKNNGEFEHCDGAVRIYSDEELNYRMNYHVRNPEVRKIGKRIKIFQFDCEDNDGINLDKDMFSLLMANFYVWNQDVWNYLN